MKKKEIRIEKKAELDDVIGNIAQMVDCLREGRLVLEKGNEFISLTPSGPVALEIEARRKKGKEKLVISIEWLTAPTENPEEVPLRISSTEPEFSEETAEKPQEDKEPESD